MKLGWSWPRGAALVYCAKVCVAAFLGYLLAFGDAFYAVYGAFSAALVVGTSRGEDVGSARNRVWGTLVGMLVGLPAAALAPHPAIAVGLGIGVTAYVCVACGWGQAAARVGASLCAVTILAHSQDAVEYGTMRIVNTLLGIGVGLAVSYFLLPVRGRDAMAQNVRNALRAVSAVLAALARPAGEPTPAELGAVFDGMVALQKTLVDARKEIGGEPEALRQQARDVAVVCIGALSAMLARAELGAQGSRLGSAAALCEQAAGLAARARTKPAGMPSPAAAAAREPGGDAAPNDTALQAFALALRKVDDALRALGH
jgi:uncharacterized membrane protein YccC